MAWNNKMRVIGNVGRDPVLRYTDAGKARLNFSLAVSRGRQEQELEPIWLSVTQWGDTAEETAEWLSKGNRVEIDAQLEPANIWGDNMDRVSVNVTAWEVWPYEPEEKEEEEAAPAPVAKKRPAKKQAAKRPAPRRREEAPF